MRKWLKPADFKTLVRFLELPSAGPAGGAKLDYKAVRQGCFDAQGWDLETGKPYHKTLIGLDLHDLTKDL